MIQLEFERRSIVHTHIEVSECIDVYIYLYVCGARRIERNEKVSDYYFTQSNAKQKRMKEAKGTK